MLIDEDYQEMLLEWSPLLQRQNRIAEKILEILLALSEKRVTLEEKMIRSQLHSIAALCGSLTSTIFTIVESKNREIYKHHISDLDALLEEVEVQISELLKIVRYNLNFLEQYFEYDFNNKLQYESRFVERLETALKKLTAEKAGVENMNAKKMIDEI